MFKGFREFIARGNMVEMAVAFVMGSAVTAIVTSLVTSIINPLIAAVFKMPNMSKVWNVTLNGSTIKFGAFIGAIINFLIIALVVYFCIVVPMNKFTALLNRNKADDEEEELDNEAQQTQLLSEIKELLAAEAHNPTAPSSPSQSEQA